MDASRDVSAEQVSIRTRDGTCPSWVFVPSGRTGRHPAVILYSDGIGLRPTITEMGRRLAGHGYVVLVPDLFYRAGPYQPVDPADVFAGTASIRHLGRSTDNRRAADDTEAFLAYLDTRDDVVPGGAVGTTGYCMGGGISLTVAGTYPDRIAAAAAFHAGNVATDSELSPHRLAPTTTARVYVAGASDDESYPPEMAERLDRALADAGVDHRCEVYPGTRHGFTMTDFPVYDHAAAERHWRELLALYADTLDRAA